MAQEQQQNSGEHRGNISDYFNLSLLAVTIRVPVEISYYLPTGLEEDGLGIPLGTVNHWDLYVIPIESEIRQFYANAGPYIVMRIPGNNTEDSAEDSEEESAEESTKNRTENRTQDNA